LERLFPKWYKILLKPPFGRALASCNGFVTAKLQKLNSRDASLGGQCGKKKPSENFCFEENQV
jgi:hypothetical protein